jgi:hypothetical protein
LSKPPRLAELRTTLAELARGAAERGMQEVS